MRQTRRPQEVGQKLEIWLTHVAELSPVTGVEGFGKLAQKRQAGRRDPDADDTAVVAGPLARDKPALLQFIEHARDVRRTGNKAVRQLQGRHRLRLLCPQETEQIVLLRRQLEAAEQLL